MEKDVMKLVDWLNANYCKSDLDDKFTLKKGRK